MATVVEIIAILERTVITKEALEVSFIQMGKSNYTSCDVAPLYYVSCIVGLLHTISFHYFKCVN
jgi:hypothetical protein